ncbi:peptidase S8/S53 domain-containing protein [Trichoderma novae-zelandiae]
MGKISLSPILILSLRVPLEGMAVMLLPAQGIIGMADVLGQGFGLVGVAPKAIIGTYRVFGCFDNVSDDIIMAAMQQAAKDGVDIISMSIGSFAYWEQGTPYTSLAESIVESGVTIIAALGNDGSLGPWAVSAPGLAPDVLAVGSVENEIYTTVYKVQNNIGSSLDYVSVFPFTTAYPLTVFKIGTGIDSPVTSTQAGGCDIRVWTAAQGTITDGAHTALLILSPSVCSFSAYSAQIWALNVTTVIFYTDDPDTPIRMLGPETSGNVTVLFLPYDQSQKILKDLDGLATGKEYTLSFKSSTTAKPQLSAPGGNILAAYPRSAGGYAVLSGTSMATPFTAGVYALIKLQRPVLMAQQGSGLINAYAALNADSRVSPSQLSLLDSPVPAKQRITVKNTSKKIKTYQISH